MKHNITIGTSTHLTRTIHRLEHILAGETYPAVRAAELLALTLLELADVLPEAEKQQMRDIVTLYEACADKEYNPFYQPDHEKTCHEPV
jgi:hypothetical protein